MKTFASDRTMVPREWLNALHEPRHHQQAHLLVVAPNKAAVQRMLTTRIEPSWAHHLTQALRLQRDHLSTPDQALVDGGIVNQDVSGVFAYYDAIIDHPVILVLTSGICATVGHFRRGPRLGDPLYAERMGRGAHAASD